MSDSHVRKLVMPSPAQIAAVRTQLGLPVYHPILVIDTNDGPAVLLRGEVLIEYEPDCAEPWAITQAGGSKASPYPTGLGSDPAQATARLIRLVAQAAKERKVQS